MAAGRATQRASDQDVVARSLLHAANVAVGRDKKCLSREPLRNQIGQGEPARCFAKRHPSVMPSFMARAVVTV